MTLARFLLCLLICAVSATARADGEVQKLMTASDRQRFLQYGLTREGALEEARNGLPEEVAILDGLLAKPLLSFSGFDMTGDWRCRTIKVGGLSPLVVYGWFKCRVSDDGSGWRLKKLSGSQRTTGRFFDDGDKRLIYLGAGSVNNDPAPAYGIGPESDQVGYAFRTGPSEWRIEFPAPHYESKLDVLEFRR